MNWDFRIGHKSNSFPKPESRGFQNLLSWTQTQKLAFLDKPDKYKLELKDGRITAFRQLANSSDLSQGRNSTLNSSMRFAGERQNVACP
jgi:hypothetical protein